jgi:hypothetical protein
MPRTPRETPAGLKRVLVPITEDPNALLLGEALQHLRYNRLLRWDLQKWALPFEIVGLVFIGWVSRGWLVALLTGVIVGYVLLALAYLSWHAWFVSRNRSNKPLCPYCTSRMWQLCCARCSEPVPPLALWLKGSFLSHCLYCRLRLSAADYSLLAWCSTCSRTQPRPDRLYNTPTHVIVWIRTSLPVTPAGEWKRIPSKDKHQAAFYHEADKHSASLMYVRDDYESEDAPVKGHLINQTRLLMVSSDVPVPNRDQVRGHFGPNTICETVSHS